jgi:hypothetical protein|eukprot:COSAG01_NODE_1739_length_9360_cov_9.910485_1_plen_141_part_00
MCRSGFGTAPRTGRAPSSGGAPPGARPEDLLGQFVLGPQNKGTYDRSDPDWQKWDNDRPTTNEIQQGKNMFKVGDTFAPHEYRATCDYVDGLRTKLHTGGGGGSPYEQVNMVAPWKANTQDKAHWLKGRADGSLSPCVHA